VRSSRSSFKLRRDMTSIFPHVPPEQMTPRARLYLLATALYCIGIGLSCALVPHLFTSSSFTQIRSMAPCGFAGWGFAHFLVAAVSLFASYRGSEKWAYTSLMGATIMVGPWAAGFWIAFATEPLRTAPTGMIAYTYITVIHLVQARQPLRSPFEPVLRSIPPPD
jgi:MFS family permease